MDINDNLYRVRTRLTTLLAVSVGILSDAIHRFSINGNGDQSWGDGTVNTGFDVVLKRLSAGLLDVTTGNFSIGGIPIPGNGVVNVTSTTVTISISAHAGRIVTLNRAAGVTATLPAATGSGARFLILNGTTVTSNNNIIQVANASDYIIGNAYVNSSGTATGFETANTGTVSTESDTLTMNGTTTGGKKGDYIEIFDVAANIWVMSATLNGSGTAATPFSAAV